ncbi:hypothetical protein [Rhodococcus sp. NPDC058521]|uniref:hypothetical protein n=1 Tax=Rhodococcus sp. NPDC058521 TaxID=3346536 RepID=UPI00364CD926
MRTDMAAADGIQEGNPVQAAKVIVDLAHSDQIPLRLPLGAEAVERIGTSYRANLESLQEWAEIARGTDFTDGSESSRTVRAPRQ